MKRVVVLAFLLSGCGSVYHPRAAIPDKIFSAPFVSDLESPTLFSDFNALPEGAAKVARRNTILFELIHLTDVRYNTYEARFFSGQAYLSTATDFATMGLDAAGAVTGTAALKSILAVVSGGITGAHASYEKNFFNQATREAIVMQMRASRLSQLLVIEEGMNTCATSVACPASNTFYSLQQGFIDVGDYYQQGTVISALEAINNSSSLQSLQARQALKAMRAGVK